MKQILLGAIAILTGIGSAIALKDGTASLVLIPIGITCIVDSVRGIEY